MYDEMTNSDLIVVAYEKAHPSDNPSSENADLIDELIVRIQRMEGRVRRWETSASLAGDTPEELERFICDCYPS
jgi:hypothetical protein